jgi:PhnB protein
MPVQPIPEQYRHVVPYLVCNDAANAIEFYTQVFGAQETYRMPWNGKIGHAELTIRGFMFMLADEAPEMNIHSAKAIGDSPVGLMLYVEDVDAVVAKSVAAGASIEQAVETKFYGDRSGTIRDPFGHKWFLATHVEDVSPEEMERRSKA